MTSPEVAKLGKKVAELEDSLNQLLRSGMGLGRSSFSNGYINQYTNGSLGSTFGTQFDGTNGVYPVTGPQPPTPRWTENWGPSAEAIVGGLRIRWEGFFEPDDTISAPMDYKAIEIYVTDQTATPSVLFDYMKTTINSARGGEVLIPLPAETSGFYVWLVTRSQSGQVSAPSAVLGPFTPLKIRESDLGFDINDLRGTNIWYGSTDPAADPANHISFGDLWLKDVTVDESTPQYLAYRRMPDDTWGLMADQHATAALASAVAAQQAADTKAKVFVQATKPTWSGPAGSAIWLDSSSGNLIRTWDGADFVLRQLGNGAIQPNSLVASDVIATGTVTAALLEAILVLATTILAGPSTSTHTEIRPDGIYVYSADANDGVPNEVIRMGTDTNDYFGITDVNGLLQLSLDVTGSVNARTANFREDIVVAGRPLTSMITDAQKDVGFFQANMPASPGYGDFGPIRDRVGLIEANAYLIGGRRYRILTRVGWFGTLAGMECRVQVTWTGPTAPGSDTAGVPGVNGTVLDQFVYPNGNVPNGWQTNVGEMSITPGVTGRYRFLLSIERGAGADGNIFAASALKQSLRIEDRGPAAPMTGLVTQGGGVLYGGSAPAPPPPPTQQYYVDIGTDNRSTYRGNGVQRGDTSEVIQGWDPSGFNGDGYGWFGFGNLPVITGSVDRVDLYLYWSHWYFNSGGTAIISPIKAGNGSQLNSLKLRSNWLVPGWPKPGGVWVTVPSDWWPLLRSGNGFYGIGLGAAGSTDETYYGRASDCRLRIWYTQ